MSGDPNIIGVVLAGGRSRRMGGRDKAFVELRGETLLSRTIARASPQVGELLINGDQPRFADFGLPVIADRVPGHLGPLAGIFAGLDWARENRPAAKWLASFACDCPFFPLDLVVQLRAAAEAAGVPLAVAASGGRHHPVFALWNTAIPETSESVLVAKKLRKMDDLVLRVAHATVEFASEPIDPFFNINMPDDLAKAESMLAHSR